MRAAMTMASLWGYKRSWPSSGEKTIGASAQAGRCERPAEAMFNTPRAYSRSRRFDSCVAELPLEIGRTTCLGSSFLTYWTWAGGGPPTSGAGRAW